MPGAAEPVRPIDPGAWVAHTEAVRGKNLFALSINLLCMAWPSTKLGKGKYIKSQKYSNTIIPCNPGIFATHFKTIHNQTHLFPSPPGFGVPPPPESFIYIDGPFANETEPLIGPFIY